MLKLHKTFTNCALRSIEMKLCIHLWLRQSEFFNKLKFLCKYHHFGTLLKKKLAKSLKTFKIFSETKALIS